MNDDLSIKNILEMSYILWDKHKDTWSPMEPEYGKLFLLYMIEEVGEVISIIKKKEEKLIMNDDIVRKHFIEEMGDILMYFSDVLNRFNIKPEEFTKVYIEKFEHNLKRDYHYD